MKKPSFITLPFLILILSCGGQNVTSEPQTKPEKQTKVEKKWGGTNPVLVATWHGYNEGNIIQLYNIDTLIKEELLKYAEKEIKATNNIQLFGLAFYLGNAPDKIPFPEYELSDADTPLKKGLPAAANFVRNSKPIASVAVNIFQGKVHSTEYAEGYPF